MALEVGTHVLARYIPEVTWGTTPATPTMQALRVTSVTPKYSRTTVQSKELTTAGEIQDYIRTKEGGGLAFNFEMSYGNLDDILSGLWGAAWATNVLKVGNTRESMSFELGFSGINQFALYKGAMWKTLALSVVKGQVVSGSAEFVSQPCVWSATTAATSVTAAETNGIMDPIAGFQSMAVASVAVDGPQEWTLSVTRNLIEFDQLGSLQLADLQLGQFVATGTIKQYFKDRTNIDLAAAYSDNAVAVSIGGASTLKYDFLFNKTKLTLSNIANLVVNGAAVVELAYECKTDPTNSTAQVTRHP
jgi:hypothetical protein